MNHDAAVMRHSRRREIPGNGQAGPASDQSQRVAKMAYIAVRYLVLLLT